MHWILLNKPFFVLLAHDNLGYDSWLNPVARLLELSYLAIVWVSFCIFFGLTCPFKLMIEVKRTFNFY
jgi:hypothetical protein